MKSSDLLRILVVCWALLTLPFYVLGALFVGSWKNFLLGFDFEDAGSMTLADLGVAVFFLGPWMLVVLFILKKALLRMK